MWNSPKKLLFFDDEEFVKLMPDVDVKTSTVGGRAETAFQGTVMSERKMTLEDESSYVGTAPPRSETSSSHGFSSSDVDPFTESIYEIGATSADPGTSFYDSRRAVVSECHQYSLPHLPAYKYSDQYVNSTRMFKEENPSVVAVTRASVTVITTGSASRRPSSDSVQLQQFSPAQISLGQSAQLVSLCQPELNELSKLQSEALGARPRTAVASTSRQRLVFDESAAENSSVQKLCSLMKLEAQVSLRHGVQRTSFYNERQQPIPCYGTHQTDPGYDAQHTSLLHAVQQNCHRQLVQDDTRSFTVSPVLPFHGNTRQSISDHCNFCKRNGERRSFYCSHKLQEHGRVTCPILQRYVCPICGATGESAHTISYCPIGNGASSIAATRTRRKSCGCKRDCKHGEENRH